MKVKVVEIRWHDMTPIFSADFHSVPPEEHRKIAHPYAKAAGATAAIASATEDEVKSDEDKIWRLATCGGDKNVRLWLVHPRPPPAAAPLTLVPSTSKLPPVKPVDSGPTVEYLATLKQHTGVVNVVRFCPVGEMLASAGDDGNILFWIPGEAASSFGDSMEDKQYEKESWRVKSMCRTKSGQEIYDLAFSPDGAHVLTGSVDHTANIYDVATGQLIHTIAEHTNYVQGVAWDPHNHFIATQSSDRSMHVYSIAESQGRLQVHAVGKNSRMEVQHPPGGSWRPPTPAITPSASEDKEKTLSTTTSGKGKDVEPRPSPHHRPISRTNSDRSESSSTTFSLSRPSLDASTSMPAMAMDDSESTNSMDPPLAHHHRPSSRRSSTSGSHPPHSPALLPQQPPFRSPSPAPLPAIKVPLSPTMGAHNGGSKIETLKLYTDANSTPFFRRLSWSTDGSLLLTPAGLFEDPYAGIGKTATNEGAGAGPGARKKVGEKQQRKNPNPVATSSAPTTSGKDATAAKPTVYIYSRSNVARPPIAHLPGHKTTSIAIRFCPVLWDLRKLKPLTTEGGEDDGGDVECVNVPLGKETAEVKLSGGEEGGEGEEKPRSLFDLPYRMVYAVATLDAVFLYDTQQAGPICMFGNLHYAPFTDLTWTPDGQTLVLSAQDGYCTVVAFDPLELGTPYQAGIVPLPAPPVVPLPASLPPSTSNTLQVLFAAKNTSATGGAGASAGATAVKREGGAETEGEPPVKKKKKAQLTYHGPLGT